MGKFVDTCPLCEKEFLNDNTVAGFKYYCSGGCADDAKSLVNNEDEITQPNLYEVEEQTPIVDTISRLHKVVSGTIEYNSKSGKHRTLQRDEA